MFSLKRLEIHKIYHESTKRTKEEKKSDLTAFLLQKFNFSNNDKYIKNINSQLESLFFKRYLSKWQQSARNNDRFVKKNSEWLNMEIDFSYKNTEIISSK